MGSAIKCQTTLKIYVFVYFLRIRSRIYMLPYKLKPWKMKINISVFTHSVSSSNIDNKTSVEWGPTKRFSTKNPQAKQAGVRANKEIFNKKIHAKLGCRRDFQQENPHKTRANKRKRNSTSKASWGAGPQEISTRNLQSKAGWGKINFGKYYFFPTPF